MSDDYRHRRYSEIRRAAEGAAGPDASLRLRARGYLDVFHASDGACRFALVAAHGALWASWYLVCAKLAALVFAIVDPTSRLWPWHRFRQFSAYVAALKDINKLVMVETYVLVHTIREFGPGFAAEMGIPCDLADDYARAMKDNAAVDLRDLYERHFLWEQERVVSTRLDDAFAVFTWPFMRNICERPWVWFSYFRTGKSMNFRKFTDQTERVEKGLIAYDRAVAFGISRLADFTNTRLKIFPGLRAWRTSPEPRTSNP